MNATINITDDTMYDAELTIHAPSMARRGISRNDSSTVTTSPKADFRINTFSLPMAEK